MNSYMQSSIKACIAYLDTFIVTMKTAAAKDDGSIDRYEKRILKQLERATRHYEQKLERVGK